jgi:hypothetical protein
MAKEKPIRSGNRKEFVRTNVPAAERVAGAVILGLLVWIGLTIAIKGRKFDPNLYTVRADSLASTAAAVEGKSQTLAAEAPAPAAAETPAVTATVTATAPATMPAETTGEATGETTGETTSPAATPAAASDGGDGNGEAAPAAPAAPALPSIPMEIALPGIKPMSPTEFYNSDNLYEKIDGRAPAYQGFNVVQLRSRTFTVDAAPGSYVDVYEYRFDTPVDAFGMYAIERDPKAAPITFAPDGYSGEMGYFFRQGAVYVQVMASDQKPETLALTKTIAENRAKELPVDDHGLAGRRRLPSDGMVEGSVTYVPEDAQGQSAFKDVFQAKYKAGTVELPFFIMVAAPDDAAKAWQSFRDFCGQFGKTEPLPDVSGGKIFRAQVFGKWKVVYLRAGELGGVVDATDTDAARAFVEKYLRGEIK